MPRIAATMAQLGKLPRLATARELPRHTNRPRWRLSNDAHLVMPAKAGIHDFPSCEPHSRGYRPRRHDEVGSAHASVPTALGIR